MDRDFFLFMNSTILTKAWIFYGRVNFTQKTKKPTIDVGFYAFKFES